MATPRAITIQYQVTLRKDELDTLRYGRRPDGSRASMPIFKPWTTQSFLQHHLLLNPNQKQTLIPTSVEELTDSFKLTGYVHSGQDEFNEENELELFKRTTKYSKISDTLYEFFEGYLEVALLTQKGLFNSDRSKAKSEDTKYLLQSQTQTFLSYEAMYGFNRAKNTAWIIDSTSQALKKAAAHLQTLGFAPTDLKLGMTKDKKHIDC